LPASLKLVTDSWLATAMYCAVVGNRLVKSRGIKAPLAREQIDLYIVTVGPRKIHLPARQVTSLTGSTLFSPGRKARRNTEVSRGAHFVLIEG
jgi:hypothetical protein